ncbi:hypothetical protein J8281_08140 [Aquimarina sp. U1-2]|uniref:hypothetical protein n=1 Tax=Aquimarina sp. U1-2 TaxID=2823141 RepID=UPI001AECC059|nr:hypothetical protein [Aquimarina sp. U1-2]MBP2832156.1 hypothetical protein [Aquimarina sp. U1-2]
MKNSILVALAFLLCIACKTETKKPEPYEEDIEIRDPKNINQNKTKIRTTAEAIAYANGLKHWDNVTEIKFTFNVDKDSTHFERSWSWKPKQNKVTKITENDTITYNRTKVDSISLKTDQQFVNDKYWLLAPFNLVWDSQSFATKHYVKSIAPMSGKEMQKLTIIYNNQDGYTPGDAYDFYFEGDFMIKEWVFRRKNADDPSLVTSWEDYQEYNGIKIAKTHKKDIGDWTLYFDDIEVITQ